MQQISAPIDILHEALMPSGANPRGGFTDGGINELADSLAQQGMLQNMLVRPSKTKGKFDIIVGERRHRAIGDLIAAGRLPENTLLPCRVVECGEADALALALVENLQRQDLAPLDEAEAFARLRKIDPKAWSTQAIAEAIGKTRRHVQLRLTLVDKLTKPVKTALGEGDIGLAYARVLTMLPAKEQRQYLDGLKEGFYGSAEALRADILNGKPPVEIAAFDVALYKGATLTDPDDDEKRYFADVPHFEGLQRQAAEAQVEKLAKVWAWAESRDYRRGEYFTQYDYTKSQDKKKAGAVVEMDFAKRIIVHTGLVKRLDPKPAKRGKPEATEFTKAHLVRARNVKTAALQRAIARDPEAALRLCVLGLMGADEVKIAAKVRDRDDQFIDPLLANTSDVFAKRFKGCLGDSWSGNLSVMGLGRGASGDPNEVGAWKVLVKMPMKDIRKLLAALVALQFGSWNGYDAELGDTALVCRVAKDVEADPAAVIDIDGDFLGSCRKPGLIELIGAGAEALETAKIPADHLDPKRLVLQTAKKLRETIKGLIEQKRLDGFVPRECRFGTKGELEAAKPDAETAGS